MLMMVRLLCSVGTTTTLPQQGYLSESYPDQPPSTFSSDSSDFPGQTLATWYSISVNTTLHPRARHNSHCLPQSPSSSFQWTCKCPIYKAFLFKPLQTARGARPSSQENFSCCLVSGSLVFSNRPFLFNILRTLPFSVCSISFPYTFLRKLPGVGGILPILELASYDEEGGKSCDPFNVGTSKRSNVCQRRVSPGVPLHPPPRGAKMGCVEKGLAKGQETSPPLPVSKRSERTLVLGVRKADSGSGNCSTPYPDAIASRAWVRRSNVGV